MAAALLTLTADAALTAAFARALAPELGAGDTLLLDGPVGAGKSHFARALIRARLQNPAEDVPSPTFTLVQTYEGSPPIWHADLYRLTDAAEIDELGLTAVTARVIEKNTRSQRVLEKVGFAFVRQENGFLHYRCEKISR